MKRSRIERKVPIRKVIPLCREHHREYDSGMAGRAAFEAKYAVNLRLWAARIAQEIAIAKGATA